MELHEANTGFGYMIEAYKIGGPYMHIITLLGIIVLVVAIWKIAGLVTNKSVNLKWLDLIRMAGSLALAFGFLSQIIGIVEALEAIRAAADISPEIVMMGAIVSFYAPIWGLMIFILSLLLFYILKGIIKGRLIE
jgi:biopolymer transport protein ExbB/TolQ